MKKKLGSGFLILITMVLVPATAEELATNPVGGTVTEEGITTHFCPEGHYTPAMMPGSEPCRRVDVVVPGQPALAVVSWAEPGGAWRFALPAGEGDLSGYTTLSLRAAVDPLSPLNAAASPQAFTLQLTDRAGNRAAVPVRPDEPALAFPAGLVEEDAFSGDFFTGPVPMTTIRWTLSDFGGVDLHRPGPHDYHPLDAERFRRGRSGRHRRDGAAV